MKKSYADIIDAFSSLRLLNGDKRIVDGKEVVIPYKFKEQACYAIAKNLNILRRHIRAYQTELDRLTGEFREALEDVKKAGGGEEATQAFVKEHSDAIEKLKKEEVEVTGLIAIKPSALDFDNNAFQPGLIADLMEAGLVE